MIYPTQAFIISSAYLEVLYIPYSYRRYPKIPKTYFHTRNAVIRNKK